MTQVERPYQFHLAEVPSLIFRFDAGVMIYPIGHRRGKLQNPVFAKKTGRKHWGLHIYISQSPATLVLDGKYWTMHEGSEFTAYAKKAHPVKT